MVTRCPAWGANWVKTPSTITRRSSRFMWKWEMWSHLSEHVVFVGILTIQPRGSLQNIDEVRLKVVDVLFELIYEIGDAESPTLMVLLYCGEKAHYKSTLS